MTQEKDLQIPIITARDLRAMLDVLALMDNPPALMVYGAPGIGKTSILADFADPKKYDLRVKHLSRMDATDWSGVPKQGSDQKFTEFLPISLFRPTTEGKRIVLFFDELNTATPQVLNAALDVILEKKCEGATLPKETIILAAGNLGDEDGTMVEKLSAAVKTRMIQVRMKEEPNQWVEWAKAKQLHPSVIRFIEQNPRYLLDLSAFRAELDQMATPRGWERVSQLVGKLESKNKALLAQMVIGTVGKKAGEMFLKFLRNPHEGADNWKQALTEAEVYYTGNVADTSDDNLRALTRLVNDGLKQKYDGCFEHAEKYARYFGTHPVFMGERSLFSGLDLTELENYLQQHNCTDVWKMIRGDR